MKPCSAHLAPQVVDGSVLPYGVWTCPGCHYARWWWDFGSGVEEETKRRVLAGFEGPAAVAAALAPGNVPTWARYELAAQVAAWAGMPPWERGGLLLRGAWAIRQEAGDATLALAPDEDLDRRFRAALDAAAAEGRATTPGAGELLLAPLVAREASAAAARRAAARARESRAPDPVLELAAAYLHRRMGENDAAVGLLAAVADPSSPSEVRDVAAALTASIARERSFPEQALPLLLEGDQDPSADAEDRAWTRIAVAETLRRLGRPAQAPPLFLDVVRDGDAPIWAWAFARHGLAKTGAGNEASEAFVAAETRAREAVRRQLRDPKAPYGAAARMGDSRDPRFLADLVAALGDDDARVREAALIGLHRTNSNGFDLPPDALAALGRLALDPHEGLLDRGSALLLLAHEASPASLPVFRAGLDDASNEVREPAVKGLARCGEAQDVPRLLAFLARGKDAVTWYERRDALLALACLANRDFSGPEDAAPWWESARGRTRMDWVLEGFRADGTDLAEPLSRQAVPALLRLLDSHRPWVRWNAHRALRALTGKRFGWGALTDVWSPDPLRREAEESPRPPWVDDWRAWWAGEQGAGPRPGAPPLPGLVRAGGPQPPTFDR